MICLFNSIEQYVHIDFFIATVSHTVNLLVLNKQKKLVKNNYSNQVLIFLLEKY